MLLLVRGRFDLRWLELSGAEERIVSMKQISTRIKKYWEEKNFWLADPNSRFHFRF